MGRQIDDLTVAGKMLSPLMGNAATVVFALALLLAGISSSITAGMAGGTIFSGIFNQPYDTKDKRDERWHFIDDDSGSGCHPVYQPAV